MMYVVTIGDVVIIIVFIKVVVSIGNVVVAFVIVVIIIMFVTQGYNPRV